MFAAATHNTYTAEESTQQTDVVSGYPKYSRARKEDNRCLFIFLIKFIVAGLNFNCCLPDIGDSNQFVINKA